MKYDPYEQYAKDRIAHCELCLAWPPNAYDEAYGDCSSYVCRAIGMPVKPMTKACGMFELDERIKAKVDEYMAKAVKESEAK